MFHGPAVLLGSGGGDSAGSVANPVGSASVGNGANDVPVVAAGVASGGWGEASTVGAVVGAIVGSAVGSAVGAGGSVGSAVGATVGSVVGAPVGAIVGGGGTGV